LIYGIQSLFQSLNIEVQDISPDVSGRSNRSIKRKITSPQYFKKEPLPFFVLIIMVAQTKKWSKT